MLSIFVLAVGCEAQEPSKPSQTPEFDPVRVVKRFPSIVEPEFASATEAKLEDNELVLGVVVGGSARAYPINMLTRPTREIINDRLGGEAIAATW